ncbi:MAG: hypothetical protein IJK67_03260 [Bacilli bacterium]|nr:hypothetical protein [Bacilli bacterium]
MYKYKKYLLYFISISYILLTIIELVKYLLCKSNIFGLIYLLLNVVIIFLLVPTTVNYNDKYSLARISKFLIIGVIGLFLSHVLDILVLNSIDYIDYSSKYIKSVYLIKTILKPILYSLLLILSLIESKFFIKIKNLISSR